MKSLKHIIILLSILLSGISLSGQERVNFTDQNGLKQGHWLKKFDNGNILYEGSFRDNKPIGEFNRYYSSGQLISVLNHSFNSDTSDALFYYSNGNKAAKGMYIGKEKSGTWKFYSEKQSDALICIEKYKKNKKVGLGTKYHLNGNKAEILNYNNDIKDGEWIQYYTNELICVKSQYSNGKLNGKFETYFPDGTKELIGNYNNNVRDGKWSFYNKDGSFKRNIVYRLGIADINAELIKEQTDYLDKLEKEGGKIQDPEKTGVIW